MYKCPLEGQLQLCWLDRPHSRPAPLQSDEHAGVGWTGRWRHRDFRNSRVVGGPSSTCSGDPGGLPHSAHLLMKTNYLKLSWGRPLRRSSTLSKKREDERLRPVRSGFEYHQFASHHKTRNQSFSGTHGPSHPTSVYSSQAASEKQVKINKTQR